MDELESAVLDAVPDPAFLFTSAGTLAHVNPAFERATGYSSGEVRGTDLIDAPMFPEEASGRVGSHLVKCLDGDETPPCEVTVDPKGDECWTAELHFDTFADGSGSAAGVGFLKDRSERGETVVERPLEDWQVLAEILPEVTPLIDISCLLTPDHEFLSINEAAAEHHGMEPEELVGRTCHEVVHDQDEPIEECPCEETVRTGEPAESDVFEENGRYYVAATAPIFGEGEEIEAIAHTVRDVTEEKRREQELQTFRQATEHSGHSIFITDRSGEIIYANPAFEDNTGYAPEEAIGQTPRILRSSAHDESFYRELWETITDGEVWESEVVNRRKDGTEIVVDQTIAPITDDGEITHFVAVNRDITDRKERERRLEDQRDNLELLHQILRHDIRNDLQLIASAAELLDDDLDGGHKHLKTIQESADHAAELTVEAREIADAMLATEADRKPVDLAGTLVTEVDAVRSEHPEAEFTVAGSIPRAEVIADDMLDSALRNLLTNAIQHNDSATPEVVVSATETEETVTVRVADNGPGIPDSERTAIFEKGHTGRGSDGSGLGLYLVRSLVETYGGDVRVEDADLGGAAFVLELRKASA